MAELSIPYAQRKLARSSPGRGGGGGAGGIAQPRIPDVSNMYAGLQGLGQEIEQGAAAVGQIATQWQKAQDLGKVTAAKGALHEQLGLLYNEITTDASIDPGTYRERFNAGRQAIMDEVSKALPSRLHGAWVGAAANVSGDLAVKIDFEGKKKGLEDAGHAFDQVGAQLLAQQSAENDPARREVIDQQLGNLTRQYVESGIFSQGQAVDHMQLLRYTQLDNQVRLDPDGMVKMLEKGPAAVPGLAPASFAKLLDTARKVQEDRLDWTEKLEHKVDRDTKKAQEITEGQVFGRLRQTSLVELGRMRDNRDISVGWYETAVKYKEMQGREDRSEARAAASEARSKRAEGRAIEEKRNADIDAQLGNQAVLGMSKEEIVHYAETNKLGPRAIDGALRTADAREKATINSAWNQAEGRLKSSFFKGPFDLLPDAKMHALRNATEELERRSVNFQATYGGQEDPLKVVDEIIPKYAASVAADTTIRIEALRQRLLFQNMEELKSRKDQLPKVMVEEQMRVFLEIDELVKSLNPALEKGGRNMTPVSQRIVDWWNGITSPTEAK